MKKLFSILAAAVLGCTALYTPVLAAETDEPVYQMGDVNMDGKVDCCDAQLALQYYCDRMVNKEGVLTEQQIDLANIVTMMTSEFGIIVDAEDAQAILMYYVYYKLPNPDGDMPILDFLREQFPYWTELWENN